MIDQSRIDELRAEIGNEDLAFVISVYIDEARTTLERIADGLSHEEHARAVHFLRSGAVNIGLRGIATLAARLESDLSADRTISHTVSARQLEEALDRTLKELDDLKALIA